MWHDRTSAGVDLYTVFPAIVRDVVKKASRFEEKLRFQRSSFLIKQMTSVDAEYADKRGLTCKEQFLIDASVSHSPILHIGLK